VRELIHDGVLNARLVERARWTLDLKAGRLWVSDVAPLLSVPAEVTAPPTLPAEEAQGWYEVTLQVNGEAQPALLHVEGAAGSLRFVGEERVFTLNDVRAAENRLAFQLPMNRSYPVEITFTGYE